MNRGEMPRPGAFEKTKASEESKYMNSGKSCPCLLIAEPTTSWRTLIQVAGHAGFASVTANHPDEVYYSLISMWNNRTDHNTVFAGGRENYLKHNIISGFCHDTETVYHRGLSWALNQILMDGRLHVFSSRDYNLIPQLVECYREWNETISAQHHVAFLVDDRVQPSEMRSRILEAKDLGDSWIKETEINDWVKTLTSLRVPFYPSEKNIREAIKAL